MGIKFFGSDVTIPPFRRKMLRLGLDEIIFSEGKELGELSIVFCSDQEILRINRTYLKHDYFTDVITFNYNQDNIISGDVYLSKDRIRENASEIGIPLEKEIFRVAAHGVLHLLGYDDQSATAKRIMTQQEDKFLKNCFNE